MFLHRCVFWNVATTFQGANVATAVAFRGFPVAVAATFHVSHNLACYCHTAHTRSKKKRRIHIQISQVMPKKSAMKIRCGVFRKVP